MSAAFLGVLIASVILIGTYFYFYFKRMIGWMVKRAPARAVKSFAAAGGALMGVLSVRMRSVWAIAVLHVLCLSLCVDAVHLALGKIKKRERKAGWHGLYCSGLIPVLCTAFILGYGYWNMHRVVRTDYHIGTHKDIREEGYRIAMISDLHYGLTMGAKELQAYAVEIEAARPDMVVLCGDIVDEGTTKGQMEEAMSILGTIESPLGTYFVHGNHDKTRYAGNPNFTAEELERAIREAGIHILADERVRVTQDFTVVGRDDRSFPRNGRRKEVDELLEGARQDDFILLLDHQPCELPAVDKAGCDLMLSGHTHAGQIWPAGLISQGTGMVELNYGYRRLDHLQAIVSSGIAGWGYPVRTSRHCEYVVVTVEKMD